MDVSTIQSLAWTMFAVVNGVYLVGRFIGNKEWTVTSNTRNIARLDRELSQLQASTATKDVLEEARARWHKANNETQVRVGNIETELRELPDRLRDVFVSREVHDLQAKQLERDYQFIRQEIESIWAERRKRQEPRGSSN